ncbi:MAG: flagellar protein, partial [Lachnospiraceae bacterium]|nr:flagellar protein [Lachnospiraceae bacterium]
MSPLELKESFLNAQVNKVQNSQTAGKVTASDLKAQGASFEEILEKAKGSSGSVKFSKHANERLQSRQIELSSEQYERLEGAVKKASGKGIKDSLVMMDDFAF